MADRDPNTGQEEKTVTLHVKEDVDENENIPHPTLELYRHTMLRGANVGSLLAMIVSTPVLLFRGVRHPAEFLRRLSSACVKGVVSRATLRLFTYIFAGSGQTYGYWSQLAQLVRSHKQEILVVLFPDPSLIHREGSSNT